MTPMDQPTRSRARVAITWPQVMLWTKRRCSTLCHHAMENIKIVANEYQISETLENLMTYALENPLLALIITIVLISCALPVLIFIIFVTTSIIITTSGILFVEGTLLAVGSAFFCAVFFFTLTMIAATATVVAITYFGMNEACKFFQRNYPRIDSVPNTKDSKLSLDDEGK